MDAPVLGVDAIRALRNPSGLGEYSRRTLRALRARRAALPIILYSSRAPLPAFAAFPRELDARLVTPPSALDWGPGRAWWRLRHMGRCAARDSVNVFHGLSHEIPRDLPPSVRSVVTFHDLLYETHPEFFPWADRESYRWRYRWSARHADRIVAVSHATAEALAGCYRIDRARIVVIPPPVDARFFLPADTSTFDNWRRKRGLPDRYLLCVATLEPRKNQRAVIEMLAHDAHLPPVALAGRDRGTGPALRQLAKRLGVGDRVIFLDGVSDAEMPVLVQSAAALVYPSLAEGFGMPIAEGLACGVPVIASDHASLDDACGKAAIRVPATDAAAWASAAARAMGGGDAAAERRIAGRAHAEAFRGARVAEALLSTYDALLGAGGRDKGRVPQAEQQERAH